MNTTSEEKKAGNLDPITGQPGAHPVGVGVGAVAGGMATGAIPIVSVLATRRRGKSTTRTSPPIAWAVDSAISMPTRALTKWSHRLLAITKA